MKAVEKWTYLILLSFIYGSAFILIKKGLLGLTPIQLASLRVIFSATFLSIFGFKTIKLIPKNKWKWIVLTGFIGNFFPVYLFSFSQTIINSSVAAVLSAMTPLFTILFGYFIFAIRFNKNKIFGVFIGFVATIFLVSNEISINSDYGGTYSFLIILATICYAINANLVKYKLKGVSAFAIALGNFISVLPFGILVFYFSDFPIHDFYESTLILESIGYILLLALIGSALANVMFNKLISISSPIFSVSVTYLLPIVGIGWGVLDGEFFSIFQWISCFIILYSIYLVTKKK